MTLSAQTPVVIMLKSMEGDEPIELQGEIVVGRGSMCDVILEKERLSRRHARLSVGEGYLLVEDLGSTNGTFLNDIKIDKATIAKKDDVIRFDQFAYQVFVIDGVEDSESTLTNLPVIRETEILDAKKPVFTPPKSWVLNDKKSPQGTQIMSLDKLKQGQLVADASIAEKVSVDGPVLVGLSGKTKGKVFRFNTGDKLSKWEIGRDENSDIYVDDVSVSNNHARLIRDGLRWKLVDLMSANGTYVNGSRGLTSYLSSGDMVGFGKIKFVFRLSDNSQTSESASVKKRVKDPMYLGPGSWKIGLVAFAITTTVLYFFLM